MPGESDGRRYRIQNDAEDKKNMRLTGYGRATLVHAGPWGATKKDIQNISRTLQAAIVDDYWRAHLPTKKNQEVRSSGETSTGRA